MALTLLQRVWNKAKNAVTSLGNNYTPLADPTSNKGNNFWSSGGARYLGNLQKATQPGIDTLQSVLSYFERPSLSNLKTNVKALSNPETAREWQSGFKEDAGGDILRGLTNNYIAPALQIPYAAKETFGKNKTPTERGVGALQLTGNTLSTLTPGVSDLIIAGLQGGKGYLKANRQGKTPTESLLEAKRNVTGQNYTGLGDVVSDNPNVQAVGNLAELPLMLMAGGLKTKGIDDNLRSVSRAVKEGKITMEEGQALLKEAKNVGKSKAGLYDTKPLTDLAKKTYKIENWPGRANSYILDNGKFISDQYHLASLKKIAPKANMNELGDIGKQFMNEGNIRHLVVTENVPGRGVVDNFMLELSKNPTKSQMATIQREFDSIKGSKAITLDITQGGRTKSFVVDTVSELKDIIKKNVAQPPSGKVTLPNKAGVPKSTQSLIDEAKVKKLTAKEIGEVAPEIGDVNPYQKLVLATRQRLEKALPKNVFQYYDTKIHQPLMEGLGQGQDWVNIYKDRVRQLGIDAGTKEDKAIRSFVKGEVDKKYLVNQFGEDGAKGITSAAKELRKIYDEIIDFVNPLRESAGLEAIPKKKDFLSQMGGGKRNIFSGFEDVTEMVTPAGRSSGIMKHQGENATTGAIESFIPYLDRAKQAGFIDPMVRDVRKFAKTLQRGISKNGGDLSVPKFINEYADVLEGTKKYSKLGQKIQEVAGTMKGAAVTANPATFFNQLLNLPQGVWEAGIKNTAKGTLGKEAEVMSNESPYLKAIRIQTPNELVAGAGRKFVNISGNVMQSMNNFTAKSVWKGFYEKAKSLNVKDPIKFADDQTVQIMGDRRLGAAGAFYNSPAGKIIGAFTLENQAGINRLIKSIGEKKAIPVIGTLLTWHVANNINQNYITGQRLFFDPIRMFADMKEQVEGSDKKQPSVIKAIGRFFGETMKLSPALQSSVYTLMSGISSIGQNADENFPTTRDIFGTEDPTWQNVGSLYNPFEKVDRRITGNKIIDVPVNLASKFISGVNPAARSTQSLFAMNEGAVKGKSGGVMYETPKDPFNKARAFLFGVSSTPNAQKYFDSDYSRPLSKEQTKIYEQTLSPEARTQYLKNAQGTTKTRLKTEDILKSGATSKDEETLSQFYFDGKTYQTAKNNKEREDIVKKIGTVMDDEDLTDEQKQQIIDLAGVDKDTIAYYNTAIMDDEDRTAQIIELADTVENREDFVKVLAFGRKRVGGKQIVTSDVLDRLYDQGKISKDEKALLTAIKYDSVYGKYYMDRDYSGGGLSAAKKKSLVNQINTLYAPKTFKPRKTKRVQEFFPTELTSGSGLTFAKPGKKTKTQWFRTY